MSNTMTNCNDCNAESTVRAWIPVKNNFLMAIAEEEMDRSGVRLQAPAFRYFELRPKYKRKHWMVYLWDTKEDMHKGCGIVEDTDCEAMHRPVWEGKLIGELHFVKDNWGLAIVAHECFHAIMFYIRATKRKAVYSDASSLILPDEMAEEENYAYFFGNMFSAIYCALYEMNPHFDGKEIGGAE